MKICTLESMLFRINGRAVARLSLALGVCLAVGVSSPASAGTDPAIRYKAAAAKYHAARAKMDSWTAAQWESLIGAFESVAAETSSDSLRPKALYMTGKLSFDRARRTQSTAHYARARAAFSRLVSGYRTHSLADDAQYYLGEIALRQKDHTTAAREFRKVLNHFPNGDKVTDAKQRLAHLPQLKAPTSSGHTRASGAEVTKMWHLSSDGYTRVVIYLSAVASPSQPKFLPPDVNGNARLYVDLKGVAIGEAVERTYPINDAFLKQARLGYPVPGVTRVALDVASIDESRTHIASRPGDDHPYLVVLDIYGKKKDVAAPAGSSRPAAQSRAAADGADASTDLDAASDEEILKIVEDLVQSAPTADAPDGAPVAEPEPPAAKKVRTIIVDAGHGGDDPGAIGYKGYKEKDVTLKLAKKLKARLYRRLGVHVVLTRTGDETLPLEKRTALANAAVQNEETDLFISLHANAAESRKPYGIETYFLNNTDDKAAMRLAAFENGDMRARPSAATTPDAFMFSDLRQNYKADVSEDLAGYIQKAMVRDIQQKYSKTKVHDLGVKNAVFFVLMGARVPSILVETGFITNPTEAERLNNDRYLDIVADAIVTGVANFIKATESGKVATL